MKYGPNAPKHGDKILVYKKGVIENILSGQKTLEIRARKYRAGRYYLGCKSTIHAFAFLGPAFKIDSYADFERLRPFHRLQSQKLPYPTTWGLKIEHFEPLKVPYIHSIGAVNIVRYRAVA